MACAVGLMLGVLGHNWRHFRIARTGVQALLAEKQPDFLILDINMPEVSGLDMLEFVRCRKAWDAMPVIMLTSEHGDVLFDKALHLCAEGLVFKPVTVDELGNATQAAFEKRKTIERR